MPFRLSIADQTGRTITAQVVRGSDGHFWKNTATQGWQSSAPTAIALTEGTGSLAGTYSATVSGMDSPGRIDAYYLGSSLGRPAVEEMHVYGGNEVHAANVQRIADQTANASGAVTFPASIGTSTYAGGAVASVTGNVGGNVAGSVGSVTGAVGSVTGNVGGSVTGSVGSVASGGITAASFAADAITAAKVAADVVAEIQSGLSTLDAAGVRTAVGLATANLDTQLSTIDTVADAIKAKTDNLPASPAAAGDAMALTSGERDTLAWVIDARLLDAGDATDLIASIVTRIDNTNVDQTAFVAAVKAALFDAGSAANKLAVNASGQVEASNMRGTDGANTATPLDAAGVRGAVGLAAPNLDTQFGTLLTSSSFTTFWTTARQTRLDNLLATGTYSTFAGNLSSGERNAIADAYLDRAAAIHGKTPREAIGITAGMVGGKTTGAGDDEETFYGLDGTTQVAVVTLDEANNRTGVTYP